MKSFNKLVLCILLCILFLPTIPSYSEENDIKEKVIYLTFDDGPGGDITISILDTLKNEQVPATFFIIGNQVKGQKETILRMKNEGHSIGLHSFSHDRNKLYSSKEGFIEEMKKVQSELFDVTGENYYILRFPFGCNNITYRLSNDMVDTIHSNKFKIYDWTQDTLDGANPNSSPDIILRRAISTKDTVVLLMHCSTINKNSAQALPGIIKYYKSQGYTFKQITEDTPEIYHITKK